MIDLPSKYEKNLLKIKEASKPKTIKKTPKKGGKSKTK